MTESQLEMANKELDRGNYEKALEQLGEARRMAVSIDDPSQLIRTSLAYSNIYFYLGNYAEAVRSWEEALTEAELSGETELAALTRIYQIRAKLFNKEIPEADVPALIEKELAFITKDRLAIALGLTVTALAEKELAHWDEAETALRKALQIHEKDRYLEQAAYDCYLIASVYSVSGRYEQALESLHQAIAFDRRSENSYGLAMDWFALGEVYKKAGMIAESNAAYARSENIKNAMQN
jgi:tetratricopeptide (TPR) repeat protein